MLAIVQGHLGSSPCDLFQVPYLRLSSSREVGWVPRASVTREEEPGRNHVTFSDPATGVYAALFPVCSLARRRPKVRPGVNRKGNGLQLLMEGGKTLEEHRGNIAVAGFGERSL